MIKPNQSNQMASKGLKIKNKPSVPSFRVAAKKQSVIQTPN